MNYGIILLLVTLLSSCSSKNQQIGSPSPLDNNDPSVKKMIILYPSQVTSLNLETIQPDFTKPINMLVSSESDATKLCQSAQADGKYTCRKLSDDEAQSAVQSQNRWIILKAQNSLKLGLTDGTDTSISAKIASINDHLTTVDEVAIGVVGVVSIGTLATVFLYSRFKKKELSKIEVEDSPVRPVSSVKEEVIPTKPVAHVQEPSPGSPTPKVTPVKPEVQQVAEESAIALELKHVARDMASKRDFLRVKVTAEGKEFTLSSFKGASVLENRLDSTVANTKPALYIETKSVLETLGSKNYKVIDVPGDGDCGLYTLIASSHLQNKASLNFGGRSYDITTGNYTDLIKDIRQALNVPAGKDLSPEELQRAAGQLGMPPLTIVTPAFSSKGAIIDRFPDGFKTVRGDAWVPKADETVIVLTGQHYVVAKGT